MPGCGIPGAKGWFGKFMNIAFSGGARSIAPTIVMFPAGACACECALRGEDAMCGWACACGPARPMGFWKECCGRVGCIPPWCGCPSGDCCCGIAPIMGGCPEGARAMPCVMF